MIKAVNSYRRKTLTNKGYENMKKFVSELIEGKVSEVKGSLFTLFLGTNLMHKLHRKVVFK